MNTLKFTGRCLDNVLVAMIAQILDNACIPNVLWGNYLLTIYGVPSVIDVSLRVAKFFYSLTNFRELPLFCPMN